MTRRLKVRLLGLTCKVDRQLNDKERYSAALEKPEISKIIEDLIKEEY